jgi:dienelactone hydrolase
MNKQAACQIRCLGLLFAASLVYSDAIGKPGSQCVSRVTQSVDALAAGKLQAARRYFNADLAKIKDEDGLKEDWGRLESVEGTYVGRAAGHGVIIEARRYVFVTMQFANGAFEALAACDKDGLISILQGAPASDALTKIKNAKPEVEPSGVRREPMVVPSAFGPLPGTLTLPAGSGRFPAVVIVAGAGQNDADGTNGPNKPYRDLAEGLAAEGVASLRYDKIQRAYLAQVIFSEHFTVDDEVTRDVLTASDLLRQHSRIDPRRQFLLGHSLGAMMAPKIASQFRGLAGMILMAPPGEPILNNAVHQTLYIAEAQHAAQDQIDAALQTIRDEQALLRDADPTQFLRGDFQGMHQNWWLSLSRYDPIVWAEKSRLPTLIMQGERDYKVIPTYSLARWKAVFAGNPRVKIKLYPGLNHFFMTAVDLPPPQDEEVSGHVDDKVIRDIAAWIRSVPPAQAVH